MLVWEIVCIYVFYLLNLDGKKEKDLSLINKNHDIDWLIKICGDLLPDSLTLNFSGFYIHEQKPQLCNEWPVDYIENYLHRKENIFQLTNQLLSNIWIFILSDIWREKVAGRTPVSGQPRHPVLLQKNAQLLLHDQAQKIHQQSQLLQGKYKRTKQLFLLGL